MRQLTHDCTAEMLEAAQTQASGSLALSQFSREVVTASHPDWHADGMSPVLVWRRVRERSALEIGALAKAEGWNIYGGD